MAALVIARLTFREASRRWILWVALLLGILFITVYGLGFREIQEGISDSLSTANPLVRSEIYNFYTMAGLYVVNFLAILMTVLTSVDTVSGEIASGTVHTLVSKPVRRWEIVLGKWLGFIVMLSLYLLLMAGGVLLVIRLVSGYTPENALRGFALLWLNVAMLLSVSFAGGAIFSTLSNGVMVFGLFGVAFIGGWIEQIGSVLGNQTAVQIGILCSLLMPSEAIWRRAAFEMQSLAASAFGGMTPFSSQSVPSPLMIAYAAVYTLIALFIAVRLFQNRDL